MRLLITMRGFKADLNTLFHGYSTIFSETNMLLLWLDMLYHRGCFVVSSASISAFFLQPNTHAHDAQAEILLIAKKIEFLFSVIDVSVVFYTYWWMVRVKFSISLDFKKVLLLHELWYKTL